MGIGLEGAGRVGGDPYWGSPRESPDSRGAGTLARKFPGGHPTGKWHRKDNRRGSAASALMASCSRGAVAVVPMGRKVEKVRKSGTGR